MDIREVVKAEMAKLQLVLDTLDSKGPAIERHLAQPTAKPTAVKKMSPETKAKMKVSQQARHARIRAAKAAMQSNTEPVNTAPATPSAEPNAQPVTVGSKAKATSNKTVSPASNPALQSLLPSQP